MRPIRRSRESERRWGREISQVGTQKCFWGLFVWRYLLKDCVFLNVSGNFRLTNGPKVQINSSYISLRNWRDTWCVVLQTGQQQKESGAGGQAVRQTQTNGSNLAPAPAARIYDGHAHTALFITFRDIWARTYCTVHHISIYLGTYLLHFSSHFKTYGRVPVALLIAFRIIWTRACCTFHHISRYMDTHLLHFSWHFDIYGNVPTALFIVFRYIEARTYCTFNHISRCKV